MEYGAIDLHLKRSLIRIVDASGQTVVERSVPTSREGLAQVFGGRAPMRVLLETGTDSEWVAQAVEACGHAVVVADPNYALMYGHRSRRIKTDRRDVAALAEACRLGIYRRAHRVSAAQRQCRRELRVREQLIRVRTQAINLLRAQLRQDGHRLPSGSVATVPARYARLALPAGVQAALAPLVDLLTHLAPRLATAQRETQQRAAADPVTRLLMTLPGIGPVTALSYRATVDDVGRFAEAGCVSAFFGLVPHEDSSAERQHRGRITKAGPSTPRSLLIQAAWVVWRLRPQGALQRWAHRRAEVASPALAGESCRAHDRNRNTA